MSEWKSVKKFPPPSLTAVLVYSKECGVRSAVCDRNYSGNFRVGTEVNAKGGVALFGTVTHWMPLPELPK